MKGVTITLMYTGFLREPQKSTTLGTILGRKRSAKSNQPILTIRRAFCFGSCTPAGCPPARGAPPAARGPSATHSPATSRSDKKLANVKIDHFCFLLTVRRTCDVLRVLYLQNMVCACVCVRMYFLGRAQN